jgi:hypothetical protein
VLLTHGWKSGDVSDGDVTSHAMPHTIAMTKRMVIVIFHRKPVLVWHGADL